MPDDPFQSLMRKWTTLGPYQALDAMLLDAPLEPDRWSAVLGSVLPENGFAPPAPPVVCDGPVDEAVPAEMNREFAAGAGPLRFFLAPAGDGHWLGMCWNHHVADSVTIRQLMRRLHAGFFQMAGPGPMRTADPPRRAGLLAGCTDLARTWCRSRRSYRVPIPRPLDFRVGVWRGECGQPIVERLRTAARALGVTVNDLFLCVLVEVLGEWTAGQRATSGKRDRIGLGVAVNTRAAFPDLADEVAGFHLTSFTLTEPAVADGDWRARARRIAAKTRRAKRPESLRRSTAGFRMLEWLWDHTSKPHRRADLITRGAPLVAGLSNVNLDAEWIGSAPHLLDYRRYSPCGPIAPLVFVPSSLRGALQVTVTHRLVAVDDASAAQLGHAFLERLAALAEE